VTHRRATDGTVRSRRSSQEIAALSDHRVIITAFGAPEAIASAFVEVDEAHGT